MAAACTLLALPAVALAAPDAPTKALDQAIARFNAFDDQGARQQLRALLDRAPPAAIQAKAHMYLGIIAVNALDEATARAEFHKALLAQATAELPEDASPKAELIFQRVFAEEVREAREQSVASESSGAPLLSPNGPKQAAAVPAAATTAPLPASAESSRSHVVAYVLGAATLALVGLAVYGGVEVLQYNAMVNAGNGSGGIPKPTDTSDQLAAAHGPASFWAVGWPVAAGLAAAGVGGAVLTW